MRIVGHKHDNDGNPVGTYHHNPMMNTRVYLAKFADGHVAEYGANVIAEAIYNQVDDNSFQEVSFKEVIGHQKNSNAMTDEAFQNLFGSKNLGHACTTEGWDICIAWQISSSSWHPLSNIKNSAPLHLAKHAMHNSLQDEPTFSWWVKEALHQKKYMLKAMMT